MNVGRSGNNFDVIRLVAAIMVMITHSYALLGKSENDLLSVATSGALQFSHLGVAIFFIISGYLIAQSAMASKTWKGYMWRRFLRIFPGLLVVLLLSAFVLGPIVTSLSLAQYFTNKGTYLHICSVSLYRLYLRLPGVFEHNPQKAVNGSLWTLAYEFSMYIGTIVGYYFGLLSRKNLVAVFWGLLFILRIYMGKNYFVYNYSTPCLLGLNITYFYEWSFYFLTGTTIFLFRDKLMFNTYALLGLLLLYMFAGYIKCEGALRVLNYLLIPYAVFRLAFIKGSLNHIGRYGDFSYGFYIYAFPVQQTIVHFTGTHLPVFQIFLFSVTLTFPLAFMSWHFIEKHFLAFKNRIN